MKRISSMLIAIALSGVSIFCITSSRAQAIDPQKSARATAISDAQFITTNIQHNEGVMLLAQEAIDRGTDARVKELAQQMLTDHSDMLYTLEQLETAGAGSSRRKAGSAEGGYKQAAELNEKLSSVSGANFDSVWVAGILTMQQAKYEELSQAKETVMNPQLKMAITGAIPLIRKHLSQLKSIQKYLIKIAIQKRKEAAALKTK